MSQAINIMQSLLDNNLVEGFATMKPVDKDDKPKILELLKPLGLKLRMKVFPGMCRLNIDSEMDKDKAQKICDILNKAGYLFAGGGEFRVSCFNGLQELAIRGKDKQPLANNK